MSPDCPLDHRNPWVLNIRRGVPEIRFDFFRPPMPRERVEELNNSREFLGFLARSNPCRSSPEAFAVPRGGPFLRQPSAGRELACNFLRSPHLANTNRPASPPRWNCLSQRRPTKNQVPQWYFASTRTLQITLGGHQVGLAVVRLYGRRRRGTNEVRRSEELWPP